MRRIALFATLLAPPLLGLSGCAGFGEFLDHSFSLSGRNPNIPMADSENVRRVLGQAPDPTPLQPEPGNVWPGPQGPEPTLADLTASQNGDLSRPPGPALPAGRQPRPQGSSTYPGSIQPGPGTVPGFSPSAQPQSSVPGPGPTGRIVNTPGGPAVDAGGTSSYRQLTTPQGPGAIMVPNGNGTSTIINPNGTVQTVPTPR